MISNFTKRHGSIFLLALTAMTILFILGFSITFFTGSEDWASAMSYESEVSFNLAESAVEEFVARLKNSLNHDDPNNQLYKILRDAGTDVSQEIPLKAEQVSKLTAYTRETARQLYGFQFGRDMVVSDDFVVDAVIKLKHINPVEAKSGNSVLYKLRQDLKEKQGELKVTAKVTYKGNMAKVTLTFLIRVVKTFVPPFNYFTLFVKDASVYGGSHFNTFSSSFGQKRSLRLDNGWNSIKQNFNACRNYSEWESMLSQVGNKAPTPPGRVYMGQDLNSLSKAGPGVLIRSTNGTKVLFQQNIDPTLFKDKQMNGQENLFLRFDVPWTGLKDYAKKYMKLQGQKVTKGKKLFLFGGWNNDTKIRIFNVGAGKELVDNAGRPGFINCFKTYAAHTGRMVSQSPGGINSDEGKMRYRLMPEIDRSGLDLFGNAPPRGKISYTGGAEFSKLSPTLVYGPAMRQYFRAVQIQPEGGQPIELPFVDTKTNPFIKAMGIKKGDVLNATQARDLFINSGLPNEELGGENFPKILFENWDKLPKQFKKLKNYGNFMSDSGVELYNKGLKNLIQRLKGSKKEYTGSLENFTNGYLENYPYPYDKIPKGMENIITKSPMREFYEGALFEALPDKFSSYLMDFYFIPRSTEDFFRGRTTVSEGGQKWDRFEFKYINNVKAYLNKVNNQTLELNGILALNDSEPLGLRNLKFRGHGIIYSSPMMGGGKVVISGDFVGADTALDGSFNSSIGNGMMTIVAPQVVIDTSKAQGNRCYVEANIISVSEPFMVIGDKPITIKGTVVTPFLNLEDHFHPKQKGNDSFQCEDVIVYNALNGIWRNLRPDIMNSMYVAKIVTGGVGKFDWKYTKTND